jgi:Flp pilus assembly protein TadG
MAVHNCSLGVRRFPDRIAQAGQTTVEFALSYLGVLLPLTFGIIYVSQLLWVWHSVNDFTRQGAAYATTHCGQSSADNVIQFMRTNVPHTVDQNQFQSGPAQISIAYDARDPATGQLSAFTCEGDCSASCIPDTVTVSVTGYQFTNFVSYLGLPPVTIPDFRTSRPMESAGCDPEQGVCLP